MRAAGPVAVAGVTFYAFVSMAGDGSVRLRLSVDEWDRLGLDEGRRVRVGLPGRGPADLLVTTVRRVPPFVWADLRPPARVPVGRSG